MKNIIQFILLSFLIVITPVFADSIVSFWEESIFLLPVIIMIEILAILLLSNKLYKKELNAKIIVLMVSVVLLANIASAFIGSILNNNYLYKVIKLDVSSVSSYISLDTFFGFLSYFMISVTIEFFIFLMFLRKTFKIENIFILCFIINIFSYMCLFFSAYFGVLV
jgi:hypothetical protein